MEILLLLKAGFEAKLGLFDKKSREIKMISVGGQNFSNYFKIFKQKFVSSLYFCTENIVSITTSQITDII